jgi:hypothetical protein
MNQQELKLHKGVKMWNVLASIFFIFLCLFLYTIFIAITGGNYSINFFDVAILALANFRLVRLFIYDNITLFLREWFMDLEERGGVYEYVLSKNAFKHTIYKLLICPWCFGVWSTFVSLFFFFTFPAFKIVFIGLAISGIASLLIILSNMIGWTAEARKKQVGG